MFCNFQQAQMEAPRGMIQPGSIQREVAFQNGGCARAKLTRHVVGLEIVTLIWMTIEGGVALFAAWTAHSLVLAAFGCDSFVELLSAALVLLQFVPAVALDRVTAARLAGILLFVLALAVTLGSLAALKWKVHPDTSWGGIAITTAALVMMPVLAWAKRRAARARGDKALAARRGPVRNLCLSSRGDALRAGSKGVRPRRLDRSCGSSRGGAAYLPGGQARARR